jgi:hypothetical protein
MLESNPHLIQLRLVQALGQSSGNNLVFGIPPASPVPTRTKNGSKGRESLEESSEQFRQTNAPDQP